MGSDSLYLTDYHIHTQYSDGGGWPEEYIQPAVNAGLSEIGFSDHLTLTEEQQDWSMQLDLIGDYCDRILRLKAKSRNIKVRLGLEIDYFPGKEEEISRLTGEYPFDFIIGSVHYMGKEPVDINPEFYSGKDIYQIFNDYFNIVTKAASTGIFDIIGHPDLVRIFSASPADDAESLYREYARSLKKADVAIELNTNGFNKPLSDFYPDRKYLHLFYEEGVPVCVNSDAHKPARIAQYFDIAYKLVKSAGYNEMALFEGRKRRMIKF